MIKTIEIDASKFASDEKAQLELFKKGREIAKDYNAALLVLGEKNIVVCGDSFQEVLQYAWEKLASDDFLAIVLKC